MIESKLFALLPDYVCTPDGMEIDWNGNLVVSCPNYADDDMPGVVIRIDKDRNISKWFEVPVLPETGIARNMGIAFDDEWNIYICDNQGWSGKPELEFKGRVLRMKVDDDGNILECVEVARNMEHPNGVRVRGEYMYVTQSALSKVEDPSGKLVSCVYRFKLTDRDIEVSNTLDDENIFATFITQDPECQYGADGIEIDPEGNIYVGNFGDGAVYKLVLDENGDLVSNAVYAQDRTQLRSTDGMIMDENGNLYIADFCDNAIVKVYPDGRVERIAQSPDCDGLNGELDQPGEPIIWDGKLIASCFDLVTDDTKVNTAHEMPATMAMLDIF